MLWVSITHYLTSGIDKLVHRIVTECHVRKSVLCREFLFERTASLYAPIRCTLTHSCTYVHSTCLDLNLAEPG